MSFSIPSLVAGEETRQEWKGPVASPPPVLHLVLVAGQLEPLAALLHLHHGDVGEDLLVGRRLDTAPGAHTLQTHE